MCESICNLFLCPCCSGAVSGAAFVRMGVKRGMCVCEREETNTKARLVLIRYVRDMRKHESERGRERGTEDY